MNAPLSPERDAATPDPHPPAGPLSRRQALAALGAALSYPAVSAWAGDAVGGEGCAVQSGCRAKFRVREQDQVWVLSSRHLCCPTGQPARSLMAQRYSANRWREDSLSAFLGFDDPTIATVFYIHGNRIDEGTARADILNIYFQLVGRFDCERPVRLVAYSWPSDQIRGPLRDVRAKASRADGEASLFGNLLSALPTTSPVGIIGYSYGARVTTGGLHQLGAQQASHPPLRVALWAAAVHHDWPLPGRWHGQSLPQAERWLICVNPCDPVLARYAAVEKCGDPTALGYAGLPPHGPLPADVEEFQVGHLVGKSHDKDSYLYSPAVACKTRETVLWREVGAPIDPPVAEELPPVS